ncbi:hypothetical protein BH23DEI1_BH23DEI1_16330 [soil metagenome]
MTNRTAAVLRQMREAIGWIDADVDGFDRSRFVADRRARQLVERNLEILSEGSRRIPRDLKATEPDVAWSALASLGNASRPPDDPPAAPTRHKIHFSLRRTSDVPRGRPVAPIRTMGIQYPCG